MATLAITRPTVTRVTGTLGAEVEDYLLNTVAKRPSERRATRG